MAEKSRRLMKLIIHVRKLKRIFRKSKGKNRDDYEAKNIELSSSPALVCCDELFMASDKKKNGKYGQKSNSDEPSFIAYIVAQRHFSLRPNIYI
ncbi:hypothetical protein CsatA_026473 [Cannabis sativa]